MPIDRTPAVKSESAAPQPLGLRERPQPPWVLLTGFEPFGEDPRNPSAEVAQALDGQLIGGHRVRSACLPVSFSSALPTLDTLLRARPAPALVLCTGLAASRCVLSFERVALNVMDARIADNQGHQPRDEPVCATGPAAYLSDLPIKAMAQAARAQGVDAEVSLSAGSFVCNQVFYGLLWRIHRRASLRGVRGGFVHLPWPADGLPPHPSGRPVISATSATLADMAGALSAAIACALSRQDDLPLAGGRED